MEEKHNGKKSQVNRQHTIRILREWIDLQWALFDLNRQLCSRSRWKKSLSVYPRVVSQIWSYSASHETIFLVHADIIVSDYFFWRMKIYISATTPIPITKLNCRHEHNTMRRWWQDPEIMAEAQKMMNDPKFQEQMKKVTESQGFKTHMKAQQEALKDPKKLEEMEKKMREKLKEGNDQLEKAKAMRAKAEAEKKKSEGSEGEEDDKKEAADDDKKEASEESTEDMPDIPNLSLN